MIKYQNAGWIGPHIERHVAYGGASTTLTEETAA